MISILTRKNSILWKAIPIVAAVIGLKILLHSLSLEILSINTIFSGIIGANVFLMGFLLSGVLGDFKESEKIPGEISAALLAIADEIDYTSLKPGFPAAQQGYSRLTTLLQDIQKWMMKKTDFQTVMNSLSGLNFLFSALEAQSQPGYVTRVKQEQNQLRKLLIRVNTIRETNFISSGYFIAVTTSVLLMAGLVLSRIEPFYESLFFVGVITYLFIYLLLLIRDLDNPFGHASNSSSEDVSLKPLEDCAEMLKVRINTLKGSQL